MSFFKHVGVANGKKVIIVQRQLSGEDQHMAAVLYSDILPTRYHDDVSQLLESPEGQAAWEFRDIMARRMTSSGENMLQVISQENFIKRVPQNQIIVKPNSKSSIRLDELVKLLNEAGRGEEAVRRLDEMDRQQGLSMTPLKKTPPRPDVHSVEDDQVIEDMQSPIMTAPVVAAPAPAAGPDMTAVLMQMMETMKSIQEDLKATKEAVKPTPSKRGRAK